MKNAALFGGIAALILLVIVGLASVFTVDQTEQAIVLRFGEPVPGRGLITTPGLHFKYPFIENVVFLDNRILVVEAPKQEVLASDNNRLDVDSFLRYRIVDPLKFYQTLHSPDLASGQLGFILNSAVRRVLSEANMTEIVRDKRADLMVKIREQVNHQGGNFGILAVDVRIRRADLPRQISEKVYSRMQSERAREAAQYRALGSQQAQTIRAKADRDVVVLLGNAQQQADQTRGAGDAERNRIFAEAYSKDPDFFAFYRSMQAYETGLKGGDTRMILNLKSDFFRFFGTPTGQPATPVAPASAGRNEHETNRAGQPRRFRGQDRRAGEPARRQLRHRRRRCVNPPCRSAEADFRKGV
ncbi:MAG: protease modulator HflC [Methylocella sp.]